MSRPTRPPIDSGTNAWDADVNDGFIQLYDRPLPLVVHAGDLASLQTARPAAQHDWCLAIVLYETGAGNALAFSDGTAWRLASNWQLLNRLPIRSTTGAVALGDGDDFIVVTGSSNVTLTLPAIAAGNKGRRILVKHKGTGTVTVATPGADTIDGAGSKAISAQYGGFEFVSDGTSDWMVFGQEFIDVSTIESDISTLQTNLSTAEGEIDTLQTDVTAAEGNITTLQSDVTAIESDITTLQTNLSTAEGNITTLQSDVTALEGLVYPIILACSDEDTVIDTSGKKLTFRMPYAMTLTGVRASLTTACATGTFTVDINEGGTSVLSTKLTIDATETTSTTAATAAVISDSALADDAEITIDVDNVGDGAAKGLKVTLLGTRA